MELAASRKEKTEKLLKGYQRYYNIYPAEAEQAPLVARCDYFEHSEKYVISRKAELWSADSEEFLYLFEVQHLTEEVYRACMHLATEDGMGRMNIGPGHMYSYITVVIVCDTADEAAVRALKKSRLHKSFHFSFHGWMDYRAALVTGETGRVETNGAGRCMTKVMKKVLYSTK